MKKRYISLLMLVPLMIACSNSNVSERESDVVNSDTTVITSEDKKSDTTSSINLDIYDQPVGHVFEPDRYQGDGTYQNPYTVDDALKLVSDLGIDYTNGTSYEKFYFKGVISSIKGEDNGAVAFNLDSETDSIYCYSLAKKIRDTGSYSYFNIYDQSVPQKNDELIIYSRIGNYYGQAELKENLLVDLKEGIHEEIDESTTKADITFTGTMSDITSGEYLIAGYTGSSYTLLTHDLKTGKIIGQSYAEGLYIRDLKYKVNRVGSTLSLLNTDNNKYLAYEGSSTNVTYQVEEFFWQMSQTNEYSRDFICLTESSDDRILNLNSSDKFGAYRSLQSSDLLFSRLEDK